ncbi:glycoside hydrolase family 31 protein [Calidifontibacillus erzurumensis]|uniref:DUF5110 domain-containing protein n=1 Tax=Calidifontibacillus erzurumensis TaxID=2741433 RepID=A0A8J8GF23_9BACI|nr:TIM-barrel domain-containing protein [Calidifontibacillus erzurumensis]NSL51956.1 DUF5110 domain-containing protein [Calidifontibacillus erzurumensis]
MLNDSSFAIHPNLEKDKEKEIIFYDIGALLSFEQKGNVFHILCENGFVCILFYRNDIVRIVMNQNAEPSLVSSIACIKQPEHVDVQVKKIGKETIILNTPKLIVELHPSPLRVQIKDQNGSIILAETKLGMGYTNTNHVYCFKQMDEDDHFYGFGEKTGFLEKRGEKLTMWNSDVFAPHNPETDPLYQSIPYFMTVRKGKAHGLFFDNTWKTTFDLKSYEDCYSFSAEGGQLDYYVFAGPTPKDVIEQYTDLTGRMPLPPKWALGYHQSKYSYKSEQEVRELADTFIEKQIPIDAIYLDIHYMDGYRVFTFDKANFPNPEKLIADLKKAGIHTVPIVDPGVKKDPEYHIYREGVLGDYFCKYLEGNIYIDEVWPGLCAFPDFSKTKTQQWWGEKHAFYTNLGIEGIWNDMNEPAVFNETKTMDVDVIHENDGELKTHKEFHNVYGLFMEKATYEGLKKLLNGKRPFLLTRAGFSGIQRYAAVWTGDNRSFWEHLEMALPMCMNLGISGVPFCGADVGGFAHDANGQLLVRWMQAGSFIPFFRNHNNLQSIRQEPWAFGEKYEKMIKKYIELRYQWLHHFYTLFKEASQTGFPVMRPLFLEYPHDPNVTNLSDQFLVGDNVLIAPILRPDTKCRTVYLPEGEWINYWTDEKLLGGKFIIVEADLSTLPIFIKRGTMIAQGSVKQSTKIPETKLEIHLYRNDQGVSTYRLYDDDGETFAYENGDYFLKTLTCHQSERSIHFTITNENETYKPSWKEWNLVIHLVDKPVSLYINDKKIGQENMSVDLAKKTITVTLNESFA